MDIDIITIIDALKSSERLTLVQLEAMTNLKKHKINSVIEYINSKSDDFGCQILVLRGKGYMLIVEDKYLFLTTINKLRKDVKGHSMRSQLFQLLVYSDTYVTSQEIEANLYITRAKVKNLVERLGKQIEAYDLKVEYRKYQGYRIYGSEERIRCYLVDRNIYNNDDKCYMLGGLEQVMYQVKLVQSERVEAGYTFKDEKSQFKNEEEYRHAVEKLLDPDIKYQEELKFVNEKFIKTYQVFDWNLEVTFHKACMQVIYAMKNNFIPLREVSKTTNYIAVNIVNDICQIFKCNISEERKRQLSQLIYPVIEYSIDSYYDDFAMDYNNICILANSNQIKLRRAMDLIRRIVPKAQISIVSPDKIEETIQMQSDLNIVLNEITMDEIRYLLHAPIININPNGKMMSINELYSYLYTRKLIGEIRDYLHVINKVSQSRVELKQEYEKWSLLVSKDLGMQMCVCYESHDLIVSEQYFNSSLHTRVMILKIFENIASKHVETGENQVITVEGVVNEIRRNSY